MRKDDTVYLKHMLDSIARIKEYSKDIGYEKFMRNNLLQDCDTSARNNRRGFKEALQGV